MTNLFGAFKFRRHHIILEECNVLMTLDAINRNRTYRPQDLRVGNCGWTDRPSLWFIHFTTSDKKWMSIIDELSAKGRQFMLKGPSDEVYMI